METERAMVKPDFVSVLTSPIMYIRGFEKIAGFLSLQAGSVMAEEGSFWSDWGC